MKKLCLLALVALCCASLGLAQDSASQTAQPMGSATSGTVKGCLSGSDGIYMLTQDETGNMIKLIGSEGKLKNHVGHEVMITGQLSSAATSTGDQAQSENSASAGANSASASTLTVSDIKMVSKQCSSSGAGSPQ